MTKISLKNICKNQKLDALYYEYKADTGHTVLFMPLENTASSYAYFATNYGSVDVSFKANGKDFITVPDGIAHYLEHKLFESADENGKAADAFKLFSKTGAQANAYTSFDHTAYLFSGSADTFYENLRILLNFVQDPYFTDENVEKERGIITQEINMYRDDPGWRVFFNCLQGVYHNNTVRSDIAGSIETIGKIDKELLYNCYNAFYSPENMVLVCAGNFDIEKAIKICEELLLASSNKTPPERFIPSEPPCVLSEYVEENLPCATALYQLMYKIDESKILSTPIKNAQFSIYFEMLFDILFGELSTWYDNNYENGIVNDEFDFGVFSGRGFFVPVFSGENDNPENVKNAISDFILEIQKNGFTNEQKELFSIIRKSSHGSLVKGFAAPHSAASVLLSGFMKKISPFEKSQIIANTKLSDLSLALSMIDVKNCCLSVVKNK